MIFLVRPILTQSLTKGRALFLRNLLTVSFIYLVKINVGRKVLADVSNLRSNLLRTEVHDGSKLLYAIFVSLQLEACIHLKPSKPFKAAFM